MPPTQLEGIQVPEFDPFSPEVVQDPYPLYADLREHAPVYHNADRRVWALSRFSDVQSAARDWATFSHRDGIDLDALGPKVFGPGDFLDMDPPRHDHLRNIVRRRFAPRQIASLEALTRQRIQATTDRLVEAGDVDIAEDLAWPVPFFLVCRVLGIPEEDQALLDEQYRTVMKRTPGDPEIPSQALDAARKMRVYFRELANRRRRRRQDDLLSDIVHADIDGTKLTEEAVGICFLLFSAGVDTTFCLIGNSVLRLGQHPDQRQLLADDPSLIPAAVEELLRYESPVQFNARITTKAIELHSREIPAGERVVLLFGSANHDTRRFPNGDQLDVRREIARHLAFGEGVHFCLGASLARLEARIVIEELLKRAPRYEIAGSVERLPIYNLRGISRLPVALAD